MNEIMIMKMRNYLQTENGKFIRIKLIFRKTIVTEFKAANLFTRAIRINICMYNFSNHSRIHIQIFRSE